MVNRDAQAAVYAKRSGSNYLSKGVRSTARPQRAIGNGAGCELIQQILVAIHEVSRARRFVPIAMPDFTRKHSCRKVILDTGC